MSSGDDSDTSSKKKEGNEDEQETKSVISGDYMFKIFFKDEEIRKAQNS